MLVSNWKFGDINQGRVHGQKPNLGGKHVVFTEKETTRLPNVVQRSGFQFPTRYKVKSSEFAFEKKK